MGESCLCLHVGRKRKHGDIVNIVNCRFTSWLLLTIWCITTFPRPMVNVTTCSSNTGSQYQNVQGHTSLKLEGIVLKEKEGKKRERERKERLYKTVCLLTTRTLSHACSQLVSKCQSEKVVLFILVSISSLRISLNFSAHYDGSCKPLSR